MAIRSSLLWLPSFPAGRRLRSKPPIHRRIRLERLETRYALTAPEAVNDNLFMEENQLDGQIRVLRNDSDADHDALTIGEVSINGIWEDVTSQVGQLSFTLDS